jgi:hypothetical protein
MRKNVGVRAFRSALGIAFVTSILCVGCEGDSKDQMVKPETPPEVAGKASMDAYLKDKGKNAGTPRK